MMNMKEGINGGHQKITYQKKKRKEINNNNGIKIKIILNLRLTHSNQ